MATDKNLEKIGNLLGKNPEKKPPAYPWQDLALRIIDQLAIPAKKRTAVFRVCKQHPKAFIEKCLNDTKELCQEGDCWKYFFKLIADKQKQN